MIVYHCCGSSKLRKYLASGHIAPPVRAWETLEQAERFSKSTDRKIILRLKFPDNAPKLDGHFDAARVIWQRYRLNL